MEIYFPDAERRQLFCTGNLLRTRFGDGLAEMICSRLQLLKRARSLALVPADSPVSLSSDRSKPGLFTVGLDAAHRLLFEAVSDELVPTRCTDPDAIRFIRILAVEKNSESEGVEK